MTLSRSLLRILLGFALSSGARAAAEEVYLPLAPGQASEWRDVSSAGIQLWIGDLPEPVREVTLVDPPDGSDAGPLACRLFLIHIDPRLNFREEFRSKRWIKRWLPELDPSRDLVAVHRRGALSKFSRNRQEIERLVDFFGTEFDRYQFGAQADPPEPRWFDPGAGPLVTGRRPLRIPDRTEILSRNHPGNLRDTVSSLARLRGRKILIHFGKDLPFDEQSVEYYAPQAALRWAQDAGIAVYTVVPASPDEQTRVSERLKSWVQATGGGVLLESRDLPAGLSGILEATRSYLVVSFDAPRYNTGTFSRLRLTVSRPDGSLEAIGGYFDTVAADLPIHQRAFLAARLGDPRFETPPIELRVHPARPPNSLIELRFPLEPAQFETTGEGREWKIFQEIHLFVGLYGSSGELLDFSQDRFQVDLDQQEAQDFFPRVATLKRLLGPRTRVRPAAVRAVVVVGQNRHISTGELLLNDEPH